MHLMQISLIRIVILILDCVFDVYCIFIGQALNRLAKKSNTLQNHTIEPIIGLRDGTSLSEKKLGTDLSLTPVNDDEHKIFTCAGLMLGCVFDTCSTINQEGFSVFVRHGFYGEFARQLNF